MTTYEDEILIPDLEENLADDPYGTAMYAVRNILHRSIKLHNVMSEKELKNLIAIDEFIRTRTNDR